MCMARKSTPQGPLLDPARVAAEQTLQARLRRRRAGAGANILTGPNGIPYNEKMGDAE